jgi:hypothetical protein
MPWRHMGKWRYSSIFLDLSTRLRWVVSFTPLTLYPRRKSPQLPSNRRQGGPIHCIIVSLFHNYFLVYNVLWAKLSCIFTLRSLASNVIHLYQWFSNGTPQEVDRCAANILKEYFKNERNPICIEIFIHSLISMFYSAPGTKIVYTLDMLYHNCFLTNNFPQIQSCGYVLTRT